MTVGAAIFVKTPGRSPVKTRLAATVGADVAEALHEQSAYAVASVADASGLDAVHWAVAEPEGAVDSLWSRRSVLVQPPGSLGVKMSAIHRELVAHHGAGILLGADPPQIRAHSLRRAAEWLTAEPERLVIGPSTDGGFWLFGANFAIPTQRWTDVAYSQSDTAQAFRDSMKGLGSWLELERLTDFDTADDLVRVAAELANLEAPLAQQTRVLDDVCSLERGESPSRALR